jgi:hypothetical protein
MEVFSTSVPRHPTLILISNPTVLTQLFTGFVNDPSVNVNIHFIYVDFYMTFLKLTYTSVEGNLLLRCDIRPMSFQRTGQPFLTYYFSKEHQILISGQIMLPLFCFRPTDSRLSIPSSQRDSTGCSRQITCHLLAFTSTYSPHVSSLELRFICPISIYVLKTSVRPTSLTRKLTRVV